jgi:DNA-directed RNA polymerase subunit alpha
MTTETILDTIAEMIDADRIDEASAALDETAKTEEHRLETMFLRGYLLERQHSLEEAYAVYETVLSEDPEHSEAAFRAARIADRLGDEEMALDLYRQCVAARPAHVNALVNLAVLCEDRGDLDEAENHLRSVLQDHPTHRRAQHFLKSVVSSHTMMYDEHSQQEWERRSAVLDMPISDFELSVRSRNCLRQMNIRTLGDLLRTTEAELLSYKNFGETSLNEIKAMLAQKNLRLGQELQPAEQPICLSAARLPTDQTGHANLPVAELELSVRSRKALQRLGISTIGELAQQSEAELMTIKNFGQTSLNEIKRQLERFGLALRQPGQ